MYSTCLFCNQSLGANEVVESFPVGRRLAFDQKRGRLWVVCRKCEKWNLTPLEERWDAIETCERLFRDTRKRVSTDNIGLAKVSEGLELVRIGEPQRPEFAAWRYGDQFGRRHRRATIVGSGMVAISFGALATRYYPGFTPSALVLAVGYWSSMAMTYGQIIAQNRRRRRLMTSIHMPAGKVFKLKPFDRFQVIPDSGPEGWALDVHHSAGAILLKGDAALRAMTKVMAHMNREGGSRKVITAAVNRIESIGDPHKLFRWVAQQEKKQEAEWWRTGAGPGVHNIPGEIRLAMEMSANEENERIALEGELAVLEEAWKEAEEIAGIADNLVLPTTVERGLIGLRSRHPRDN